jgi:hypothetical protein
MNKRYTVENFQSFDVHDFIAPVPFAKGWFQCQWFRSSGRGWFV